MLNSWLNGSLNSWLNNTLAESIEMATKTWEGGASAVAEVQYFNLSGTFAEGETITITIGNSALVITLGAGSVGDVDDVGDSIVAAFNGTTLPAGDAVNADVSTMLEFTGITASYVDADDNVILTADAAGIPFTFAVSTDSSSGIIGSPAIEIPATGPNHWDNPLNWSDGLAPNTNDLIIFTNSSVDCLYGLGSSSLALTELRVEASYTGRIGLARTNPAGYVEYRQRYLLLGTTTAINIYGGGRVLVNNGTAQATINVFGTAGAIDTSERAFMWKGTNASNVVNVYRGSVGIAMLPGETATVATLRVGFQDATNGDADVLMPNNGATTVLQSGSTLTVGGAVTTATVVSGRYNQMLAGTLGTLNLERGATCFHSGTGTITNLLVGSGSGITFDQQLAGVTVTNTSLYGGGAISDRAKRVTWTNGIDLIHCGLGDVRLDLGSHVTVTPSAV